LVRDEGSLVGLYVQDYKYVCVQRLRFVSPWLTSTGTNTQTDRQTAFDQLIKIAQSAELK